ncbi:hypothetical protein A2303_05770 [Candidatus Falkowbacteria bacterium RIFOXYB2_FULL_47_14]|uniref:Uncharacterized protein n=1 Tax=Candidatus Falkowbacteria bacterium RIFOXYA2_FULL_47_19 TaxID=1797994 RepID=A0A1F5SEU5_9BACT|nr:MAG: hypothetical protein A2227_07170 [Candidatus Falkowbacteria bacterium RIFOXYA2_FULL_47_19]OGF35352.1 MAG: hypothetical protein A2468_00320 [Candidatus Falkowbacteria bacterium RIFOXYC2_FULL_46_15]OGF43793.1 MAG: hypothetical protein A2303_05770 [Candidatus Falkowbacteria bacterium RIFOXYB2_FULL_47_14]
MLTSKPQQIKIIVGIFGIVLLAGITILISNETKIDTQIPLSDKIPTVEELQQEMSQIAQYEFEHGCVEKNERGQDVFCGESKKKVDVAEARYNAAVKALTMPDDATMRADTDAIKKFMGDANFVVEYSRSQSPANFNVGMLTKLSDQGDERIDTPQAWKRIVNIYRATKEIEETCQVYEYEVYPKTHDIVEVRVVYPEDYQGICTKGDLFLPKVSEAQIKEVGKTYLKNLGLAQPLTVTPVDDMSRWQWKWQDEKYKLSDELVGRSAVDSKPTVRLFISSAGKLLQYNNTVALFEN